MKKRWLLATVLILLPAVCSSGQYTLVMSKNDCLCRHMLKLYNSDIKKYGKVKYRNHKEFNWIKWEDKKIGLVPPGPSVRLTHDLHAKIAYFDINNDSKDEAIVHSEGSVSDSPTDDYDVFNYDDVAILNETVDGRVYYGKRLKGFSSEEGVPVNLSDLSEEDAKKLPDKRRYSIEAKKKRGDKYTYFVGAGNKINFLRFKDRFLITFEERSNAETLAMALDRFYSEGGDPKTSSRSNEWLVDGFNNLEKYSMVSEYQKDNTLNTQCLYFGKDNPAKREVK